MPLETSVRIAFDATPLLDRLTGVGVFTNEVLARLARRPDLTVVTYGLTRLYRRELAAAVPRGVSVSRWPVPARSTRRLWLRANWPTIETWVGKVDVVHGPNFVVPPARHAAALVTIHDLTPVRFPELCDDNTIQYPALIRRALGRGAHVHTVSNHVRDDVIDLFGVEPARVHVVPNGVTPVVAGSAARGRALVGADQYVLSLSTIEPRKNLPTLVAAFDAVAAVDASVRLAVVGPDGPATPAYEDAVARCHHADRVVRLGWVSDEQRGDLLAGATVLAYPSRYEGFGLPPLEAMSAGLPVVSTTVGAIPEVVGDAALLVPADDADALGDALLRVLGDESLRRELIDRGHERVAAYSWDTCADGLVALYASLAGA
jgi:glycosyltransferase involved in cell wall biosynthesis